MLDLSKYEFTKTPADWAHDWALDPRHIQILHALALRCTGNVVEIGCFRGRSTAALIEAINAGATFDLHLVDIKITDELRRVVSMCNHPERVHIHETHSTAFRLASADLWIIDGDHTWPAVLDVLNALASDAKIIAMHDTNAHACGYEQCEGAALAAAALREFPTRACWEDTLNRKGEATHRGFLASVVNCMWPFPAHVIVDRAFEESCGKGAFSLSGWRDTGNTFDEL